ncbi:TPA: hypothetical protein ACFNMH_001928 [Neisseria elongata]
MFEGNKAFAVFRKIQGFHALHGGVVQKGDMVQSDSAVFHSVGTCGNMPINAAPNQINQIGGGVGQRV